MRRGCISLGEINCDGCLRTIETAGRYLAIDEEGGVEVEMGKIMHYCVDCAFEKGYAGYEESKHERTLTFFPKY
ncbi:hypothetical protein ACFLUQ_00875 [Chloroflexota bacterium]